MIDDEWLSKSHKWCIYNLTWDYGTDDDDVDMAYVDYNVWV